jgi:hypothetical protein
MSIERIYGEIAFICDECSDTMETGEADFTEALANAKMEGWVSMKVGGDWNHYCSGCSRRAAAHRR